MACATIHPGSNIIRALSLPTWSMCPPFDDADNPLPISYHKGTLHHCFERGWFWVIPFNNNPLSTNPLISVGLTIDPRRYPKPTNMSAEQEFNEFLKLYPSVAEQFKDGKASGPGSPRSACSIPPNKPSATAIASCHMPPGLSIHFSRAACLIPSRLSRRWSIRYSKR